MLAAVCAVAAEAPATFKVSEFSFTRPASWEWVEVFVPMRKAQLKINDEKNKTFAEVIFFHFGPGDGGGTKANVNRWFSQFKEPREKINARTEEVTVGNHKVTYVDAEGTYQGGLQGSSAPPKPNYALSGAIIESSQGNVFIRMTGPSQLVRNSTSEFRKMVESGLK